MNRKPVLKIVMLFIKQSKFLFIVLRAKDAYTESPILVDNKIIIY